ncbi:hypothetical protein [Tenacibaculum sp. M341]|uniref:hypothetical protein n=1 Tax=Tenacibaculum sp. M341 TaxID=2530339 RepID=UPI001053A899|nr:hypothetical protein [Tenacibaculum sp. M341]TCI94846.1 hypothetical protein EYW44_00560 [Tenacibaculum sp. M341]
MKKVLVFITIGLSFFMIACTSNKEKRNYKEQKNIVIQNKKTEKLNFEELQDSLRTALLKLKNNNSLKSGLLEELYIRNLVREVNGIVKIEIPFNLHSFDCGAPDCYSTNISFEFLAKESIEFPKKVDFTLLEKGCGIVKEMLETGTFELIELTDEKLNYYSKKMNSNLIIYKENKETKLFYFPDSELNPLKVNMINKVLKDYEEDGLEKNVPYQSTFMLTRDYSNFIN